MAKKARKKSRKKSGRRSNKPARRSARRSAKARRAVRATATKPKPSPRRKPKRGPKPKALQMTMGFLIAATERDWRQYINAFQNELKRKWIVNGAGHGPDRVTIDFRPAAGAAGNLTAIEAAAQRFVDDAVNIIVTSGTQATQACMAKTTTIPIVFAAAGDPKGSGLVTTLRSPGGNVTGCTNLQTKDEVLTERIRVMIAKLNPRKVGIIGNATSAPVKKAIDLVWAALDGATPIATKSKGYFQPADFKTRDTIKAKLQHLHGEGVDVLYVCSDPLLTSHLDDLTDVAKQDFGMKTMHEIKASRGHGGDQLYGLDFEALFVKAAEHANRIMRGDLPKDIEVYVPTTFEKDPP